MWSGLPILKNEALSRLKVVGQGGGNARIVEQDDFPWYASLSFMWSSVEVNLGIVCACVPGLKPLFLRFLPNFINETDDQAIPGGGIGSDVKISDDMPDLYSPDLLLTNAAAMKAPSAADYRGGQGDDEMGFPDFLSGPAQAGQAPEIVSRSLTNLTRIRIHGSKSTDSDFYNMNQPKSLVRLSNRQAIAPVAIVTIVFFLWEFAYGLLNVLNGQFELIVKLTKGESLGLHAAYYGGYFVGPLTLGRFMLKSYGFKTAMITGLCLYSCGTLVSWPSAVLTSYCAFVISNFVVELGLSCLEIAANPFIALCGPLEYVSQGFQAIGTVFSPLLAQKVFFKNVLDAPSLVNVQWTYLAIALFDVILAAIFYYLLLPEASNDALEEIADRRSAANRAHIGPLPVVWVTLGLGVFSQ